MVKFATTGTHEDQFGGGFVNQPGYYHVEVAAADDIEAQGYVNFKFTVQDGKPGGQKGKTTSTRFYYTNKDNDPEKIATLHKRLYRAAYVLGLVSESDAGKELDIDFDEAVGGQCIIKLEEEEYEKDGEKRTSIRMPFFDSMFRFDDPRVKDVPVDQDAKAVWEASQNGSGGGHNFSDI